MSYTQPMYIVIAILSLLGALAFFARPSAPALIAASVAPFAWVGLFALTGAL